MEAWHSIFPLNENVLCSKAFFANTSPFLLVFNLFPVPGGVFWLVVCLLGCQAVRGRTPSRAPRVFWVMLRWWHTIPRTLSRWDASTSKPLVGSVDRCMHTQTHTQIGGQSIMVKTKAAYFLNVKRWRYGWGRHGLPDRLPFHTEISIPIKMTTVQIVQSLLSHHGLVITEQQLSAQNL